MADLDLLVEYVNHLQTGLDQAEKLTRAGELGQAVWAYLAVLEVDPDNVMARRQVGNVVTAVRQFDEAAPGRRWLNRIRGKRTARVPAGWLWVGLVALLVVAAFVIGYCLARWSGSETEPLRRDPAPMRDKEPNTLG